MSSIPFSPLDVGVRILLAIEPPEKRGENWMELTRSLPKKLDWDRLEKQASVNSVMTQNDVFFMNHRVKLLQYRPLFNE